MANPSYRELLAKVDSLIRLVDGFQAKDAQLLISEDEKVAFLAAEHEICQAAETMGLLPVLLLNADRPSRRRGLGRTRLPLSYAGAGGPRSPWIQDMVTFRKTVAKLAESEGKPKVANDIGPEERALALLVKHPDWSQAQMAQAVGVGRTSLYRFRRYQAAREALQTGKADMPRGSKDKDGNLEAWEGDTFCDTDG